MSQQPPSRPDLNRNAERKAVRMPATCRSANGLRDEGWLEDISAVGCCFVTRGTTFKVGSHVMLRPGGIEGIPGVVRWVRANRCGVQFSSPIYGAVVDHLCKQFGDAAHPLTVEAVPRYRQHPVARRMF
jgi:hypothetical protein